jgi:hypothetical protein
MILKIFQLYSKEKGINEELYLLTRRLLDRGYNTTHITPLFSKDIANTQTTYQPMKGRDLNRKKGKHDKEKN